MSNITIYRFALDMTPGGVTPVVHLSQYDEAFQLEFTLYSRSGELDIPSGATAMIEGTKLDGKAYSANATISGNVVTVAGDVQISAVAGNNPFQIVLKSGNSTVGSANFTISVEHAAMDYDTVSDSKLAQIQDVTATAAQLTAAAENVTDGVETFEALAESVSDMLADITDDTLSVTDKAADAAAVGNALAAEIAPKYSTSATYAVGDYVLYNNALYRCNTAITTAESWTAAHWTAVKIGSELGNLKSEFRNSTEGLNQFSAYYPKFEQKGIKGETYIHSTNRISITEPFTVSNPLFIKALNGYRLAAPIWDASTSPMSIKRDSGWVKETVLTPGYLYTITVSREDNGELSTDEATNVIGNVLEQNDIWDRLENGKRKYKGGYIQGTPLYTEQGYTIDFLNDKRVMFSKPIFVRSGSAIKIIANGQGFFSARFKTFDGTYLTDYIDGATTRYTDYFWNIDEDSYIYVVFRKSVDTTFTPSELTGSVEIYEDYAYVNDRYGSIRNIFESEMQETLETVRGLMTEPCLVFPLVTDIHHESKTRNLFSNFDQMIDNIRRFSRNVHCDFLVNLGDNTDGDDVAVTLRRNDYMLSRFIHLGLPYYQAIGNHDTNYVTNTGATNDRNLTIEETYRSYISATKDAVFNQATNGTDYYKDFDQYGVRLVVLNVDYLGAYVYSGSTVTWLEEVALNTDKIILLAVHLSSISSQNWNNNNPTNSANITAALQSFVNNGGTVIQMCGHSHTDYSFETPWLCVFSNCQKFEQADLTGAGYKAITGYDNYGLVAPERTAGTATEDSWSVVVLRPHARKINFVRFGAGNDREYTF